MKAMDFVELGIFIICVALTVVYYAFGQKFGAIAFGLVSIVYLFYVIVKIGNRYVEESKEKMKKGEL